MRQSLRLGHLAGIPVGADWSVFVILALIAGMLAGSRLPSAAPGRPAALYWVVAVPTAALFLASLLAHEGAHALVARKKGIRVRSITLWMLGGVAQLGGEPGTARADFLIAVAGPVMSLVCAAVFIAAGMAVGAVGGSALIVVALGWAGAMNVLLAVFNLLPGAPLDGGRILRALIWMGCGDRARANRVATGAGQVLGAVLIGAGLAEVMILRQPGGLWLSLVGWFIIWTSAREGQAEVLRVAMEGLHVGDVMRREPLCALAWRPVREFVATMAVAYHQSVFPVIGVNGEPLGIITFQQLSRLPPGHAGDRVDSLATALPADYRATPGDPASTLLDRPPLAGVLLAVVLADGRVIGMVTTDDLGRLVRQSQLRQRLTSSERGR